MTPGMLIMALAMFLIGSGRGAAANISSVAAGQTMTIDAHGVCKKVTNNGGPRTMIPYGSAGEWALFRNNKPGHISLADCPPPCGGRLIAGFCWYKGGPGQSCNTVCASRGGCDLNGTRNYAGSGGSRANCQAITNAFGEGAYVNQRGGDLGCSEYSPKGTLYWLAGSATTCGSSVERNSRFCACNN